MKLSNQDKNKSLTLTIFLFVVNIVLFTYLPLDRWWSILVSVVFVALFIYFFTLYIKSVRSYTVPDRKKVKKDFFVIVFLYIVNMLMFDYSSWDIWWISVVRIILISLNLWLVYVYIKMIYKLKKNK